MTEKLFIELVHQEEGKLFRIALGILGQESDAWDALQETVEQAWRNRRQLRGGQAAFPAWVRRILINRSLNILHRRKHVISIDTVEIKVPGAETTTLEAIIIRDLVQELDEKSRQVILLRYLGDLSLQEIARELEIPLGTVKSRLNTAHNRLKEKLVGLDERGISHEV